MQNITVSADGIPRPVTTEGDFCLNLRSRTPCVLEGVPNPEVLARCKDLPVFADSRCGTTNIFTLGTDGRLSLGISVSAEGEVTYPAAEIATIVAGECQAARCGDFVVVRDSRGNLYHLKWHEKDRKYTMLGAMPELPRLSVKASVPALFQALIPAAEWPEPVEDLRKGIPVADAESSAQAVKKGITTALADAKACGLWTSPVCVRFALRMWDGSLMSLSDPVPVMPFEFASYRHASLSALLSEGKFTGTGSATLDIPVFSLKLQGDAGLPPAWSDIVSHIEVWVSRTADTFDPSGTASAGYTVSQGVHTVRITPPLLSEERLASQMLSRGYILAASFPCGEIPETELFLPADDTGRTLDTDSSGAIAALSANAVEGHGGFLHLAGYSRSLPELSLPSGLPGATQKAECRVAVTLSSLKEQGTVVASGEITADDAMLLQPFWYPSCNASSVTISLKYADGKMYERTWPMHPAPGGENAACVLPSSALGVVLPSVAEWSELKNVITSEEMSGGTLVTMKRGNPFVPVSVTPYAGGYIHQIRAQQRGGGAYTRQYLYLFSDNGISALAHDMNGHHVNCRPLSCRIVTRDRHISVSDTGVWALSDCGSLLRLRDSKVDAVMHGFEADAVLGCDLRNRELWIMPGPFSDAGSSVVLDMDSIERGELLSYVCSFAGLGVLRGMERMTAVVKANSGYGLCRMTQRTPRATLLPAEWVSPCVSVTSSGVCNAIIMAEGEADMTVEVRCLPHDAPETDGFGVPTPGELLSSFTVRGTTGGIIECPFLLPSLKWSRRRRSRLRLIIRGTIPTLRGYAFESRRR